MKRNVFIFVVGACFSAPLWALNSVESGPWSSTSTWGGTLPGASTPVVIVAGHEVTVDVLDAQAAGVTVNAGGTLRFSTAPATASRLTLVGGDLLVSGTLALGNAAGPVPEDGEATLVLARGATAGQFGLQVLNGGVFTVRGAVKSPHALAASDALQGATSVTVPESQAVGWKAGDVVTLGRTEAWDGSFHTEERTLSAVEGQGTGTLTLRWSAVLQKDHRRTPGPFVVGNLTRNAVVRSSGTDVTADSAYVLSSAQNAGSMDLAYGEFVHLGANAVTGLGHPATGLAVYGGSAPVSISSCAVHHGYRGIQVSERDGNVFIRNNHIHGHARNGLYLFDFFSPTESGILAFGNSLSSNTLSGVTLIDTSAHRVEGGYIYDNGDEGIGLRESHRNSISDNAIVGNGDDGGIDANISSSNTISGNDIRGNGVGIRVQSASSIRNVLVGNRVRGNLDRGLSMDGAEWTLAGNFFYANGGVGLNLFRGTGHVIADGGIGIDPSGAPAPNGDRELSLANNAMTLILKNVRLSPADDIRVDGMNQAGSFLASYNQDGDEGILRVTGDLALDGSLALEGAARLYAASASTPKLMWGSSPATVTVAALDDALVATQLITLVRSGGSWSVTGSVSGGLGSFPGPMISAAGFTAVVTGTPQDGDVWDFALIAASADAGRPKNLLFRPAGAAFNGGKSRLFAAPGTSLTLRGTALEPVLVDRYASSDPAYTFVSSGTFTAENVQFQHLEAAGLQLSGSGPVVLSSATFGNPVLSPGDNAFITARDLSSTATFSNGSFGGAIVAPGQTLYNIRVVGSDAGLSWAFQDAVGGFSGPAYESDPNGKVRWLDAVAPAAPVLTSAAPAGNGAVRLTWTSPGNDASSGYFAGTWRVYYSTNSADLTGAVPAQAQDVFNASNPAGATVMRDVTGLLLYATHYFQLWAQDETPNTSPASNDLSALPPLTGPQAALVLAAGHGGYLPRTATLGVGFDKTVADATVPGAFRVRRVRDNQGSAVDEPVLGTVTGTGQSFSFAPSSVLAGNSVYEVTVSSGVEDSFGAPSTSPVTALFTTMMDPSQENVWDAGNGARVRLPAASLTNEGYLAGASVDAASPMLSAATRKMAQNADDPVRQVVGAAAALTVHEASGAEASGVFLKPVTVTLPYADADGDGIVDGSVPPARVKTLAVHWLDERNALWVRLPSMVDTAAKTVSASAAHFTTFALLAQGDADVSEAYAFPVPFTPASGRSTITFTGLGQLATIDITTVSGDLVRTLRSADLSGQVDWDLRNEEGRPVTTGIYLYRVHNGQASKTGKLAVVR